MKRTTFIVGLFLLMMSGSAGAIVLPDNEPTDGPPAGPNPVNQPSSPELGQAPNQPALMTPSGNPQQTPMPDFSKLTPDQSRELLRQAKDLKPEQLEAIARSFQQQPVAGVETTPTVQPANVPVASPVPSSEQPLKSIAEMQRDEAFNALINEQLPLSPEQITRLHKYYDLTLQAKATPPAPPPTPHFVSTNVNLEPGGAPPVIRLAAGFVTSLIFVDFNGDPWPLTAYSIGDPQNFNVQWDQKSHTIFVQSLKKYSHGNLAVRLWGLDTPVMITLVSGQKNVDFRVDLRVPGRGPDSKPPVVQTLPSARVNPILINILDGIPPRGSIRLSVSGGYGEAWLADSRVYFRTKLTVLSPAWTATVASPDGTHVYELMPTPFILATENGKTIDIKLSGL